MGTPHVVRIACPGANGDDWGSERFTTRDEELQTAQAFCSLADIGMDHIERAGDCGYDEITGLKGASNLSSNRVRQRCWRQGWKAGAKQIELNVAQTGGDNRVQDVVQSRAGKGSGKDAEVHADAI